MHKAPEVPMKKKAFQTPPNSVWRTVFLSVLLVLLLVPAILVFSGHVPDKPNQISFSVSLPDLLFVDIFSCTYCFFLRLFWPLILYS